MAPNVVPVPAGVDPVELVRRYEPVIRFTAGELFFPMAVDAYVEQAALWGRTAGQGERQRLVDHGDLDLDVLCSHARTDVGTALELRYVPAALTPGELRQWRRDPDRARFRSTTRFAAVGLLGRIIDSLFRLSLILRGSVPGGLTAALHRRYRGSAAASNFPYYAHISSQGGYVVVQYWFFYAMNDWRSSFGGVNDHEADWEQVTVFLVPLVEDAGPASRPDGSDVLRVGWVAFSSHDETGDDLRRRCDDPDITWVDHTHPVVYAGAGSHSGAYLPGEYLVRVEPPALQRFFAAINRARGVLFPWTRDRPAPGVGIPYVDYKRGDGVHIGPGTPRGWTPVLITAETPWVRDFSGLWGLDTDDPFGGERAPAGPRYERNGTIRPSWADPVGWAGPGEGARHRSRVLPRRGGPAGRVAAAACGADYRACRPRSRAAAAERDRVRVAPDAGRQPARGHRRGPSAAGAGSRIRGASRRAPGRRDRTRASEPRTTRAAAGGGGARSPAAQGAAERRRRPAAGPAAALLDRSFAVRAVGAGR